MRSFSFKNLFKRLSADREKRDDLDAVPRNCRECELLGICRDKNNDWKCRHGCMVLNSEREIWRKVKSLL